MMHTNLKLNEYSRREEPFHEHRTDIDFRPRFTSTAKKQRKVSLECLQALIV